MTDISLNAPISLRRPGPPRLRLPKPGFAAALAALSKAIMQANALAYVAPFQQAWQPVADQPEADADGRDPRW